MDNKIRLQKYLSECGIGSRRKCEEYISQGRVTVNNSKITELGTKINPDKDIITFDGKKILKEKKIWIMLNKPPKYICSSKDPKKRSTFLNLLPNNL